MLVLHAGPAGWLPGGFLGVSLFFTLSGYLIGSLVLAEVAGAGRLDLTGFWSRRVRRLVPALVLTVLGVAVLSRFIDLPRSTRGELLGGLGYVANWVQVASGESYAQLFESPSAATHLWSLAIEEQFYLVFPFLAWLVVRRVPGGLRRAYVAGGLLVVAVGVLWAAGSDDQVFSYYGTPARAPEVAVGLVMAGLWPMGDLLSERRLGRSPRFVPAASVVGSTSLVLTVALWWSVSLTDGWIYSGGLAAVAVVSAGLLLGAVSSERLAGALSVPPLPDLGKVSYGLYLYHWPVVVLLSSPRVELEAVPLFVLRVGVSLVLAVASYRFVEQPIRRGQLARGTGSATVVLVGLAALAITAAVIWFVVEAPAGPAPRRPAPAVVAPGSDPEQDPTRPEGGEAPADPTVPPVPVVALLGDSLPNWLVRDGGWALDPSEVRLVDGTSEGCDGAEGSPVGRAGTGVVVTVPESCTGWTTQYPPVVEVGRIDLAVLAVGTGAVLDRQLDGGFVGPCSDAAADWYRADVVARLRFLADHADQVVVVLPAWAERWSGWVNPPDHEQRTDCVRATLRAAVDEAATTPPVAVVDLGRHLCPEGAGTCSPVRSTDGVHIDAARAGDVLAWVVEESLAARSSGD